ncbi:hypothetical protein AXF42_Ash015774 [Apostasia shenzhenica]|uniref:Uncharacterized protein n=1 Tax=Apostasia shenzhenica TaxID=1088818 RepID=A0A2H9ZXH4_9ASPA|nr:hypothetical protein AXF42_Ash015774 [Apostasia shenzhenica]
MSSAGHLLLFLLAAAAGGQALGQSGNLENPISYDRLQILGEHAVVQYNKFCETAKGHEDKAGDVGLLTVLARPEDEAVPAVYAVRLRKPNWELLSLGFDKTYIPTHKIRCPN